MCEACKKCLKCPGKVLCCCCECACTMLTTILCSVFGLIIIIGLIVYFTVFFNKDSDNPDETAKMIDAAAQQAPESFRDFFKSIQ